MSNPLVEFQEALQKQASVKTAGGSADMKGLPVGFYAADWNSDGIRIEAEGVNPENFWAQSPEEAIAWLKHIIKTCEAAIKKIPSLKRH